MSASKLSILSGLLSRIGLNPGSAGSTVDPSTPTLTAKDLPIVTGPAIKSGMNRAQRRARAYGKGSRLTNKQRRELAAKAEPGSFA